MSDPILVEVTRGGHVESAHRGAVSVHDFDGKPVLALGDVTRATFPRSSVKAIQALPLIETGAADALGWGNAELAMSCASHKGEPGHVERATKMLGSVGLGESALECGSHWPSSHEATLELARAGGAPNQLHNNCSGKHSGFLATCRHCGIDHHGYVAAGHPMQEMIRETMAEVTGAVHSAENSGIDGCSIPTYAVPLQSLSLGFARMGGGRGLGEVRARAAQRLIAACMAEPFYVAGSGGADTDIMLAGAGRIFVKGGAEGLHCGVVPELGLAFAVKCDDGGHRGSDTVTAALLEKLFAPRDPALAAKLGELAREPIKSRNGAEVGGLRPAAALSELKF